MALSIEQLEVMTGAKKREDETGEQYLSRVQSFGSSRTLVKEAQALEADRAEVHPEALKVFSTPEGADAFFRGKLEPRTKEKRTLDCTSFCLGNAEEADRRVGMPPEMSAPLKVFSTPVSANTFFRDTVAPEWAGGLRPEHGALYSQSLGRIKRTEWFVDMEGGGLLALVGHDPVSKCAVLLDCDNMEYVKGTDVRVRPADDNDRDAINQMGAL